MEGVSNALKLIRSGTKDRDIHEGLKILCKLVYSRSLPLDRVAEVSAPALWDIALRTRNGRLRAFVADLLRQLLPHSSMPIQPLQQMFSSKYDSKPVILSLLRLLATIGEADGASANMRDLLLLCTNMNKDSPMGLTILCAVVQLIPKGNIPVLTAVEESMARMMLNARSVHDIEKPSTSSILSTLKKTISASQPVTEPDGSVAREFFTILNGASPLSVEQEFNVFSFSIAHTWLTHLHGSEIDLYHARGVDGARVTPGGVGGAGPHRKSKSSSIPSGRPPPASALKEAILVYCKRVLEQCRVVPSSTSSPGGHGHALPLVTNVLQETMPDATQAEAVRLLDWLCTEDSSLCASVFPLIKKAYSRVAAQSNGCLCLIFLQFFIHHSDTAAYDAQPSLHHFFANFLSEGYADANLVFDTLEFLTANRVDLLSTTDVFSNHFPAILKTLAWNPTSHREQFLELLPSLVDPTTYIELFHSLLDLPLMAAAMERNYLEKIIDPSYAASSSKHRVVYNYILRNESGASINFWQQAMPLLELFFEDSFLSPRIEAVVELVPTLLDVYFDVLITHADEHHMAVLIPVMFERLDQLFPLGAHRKAINDIVVTKVLAIFRRWPSFVYVQKDLILNVIADSTHSTRTELVLHLCWCIGEYCNADIEPRCTPRILNEYHEALELLVYERMSLVKLGLASLRHSSDQRGVDPRRSSDAVAVGKDLDTTRFMMVMISALAKLASRWQDLASRVMLCLAKLMRDRNHFHEAVLHRANECVQILKRPSIASAVLDCPLPDTQVSGGFVDRYTSLPFLLLPRHSPYPVDEMRALHEFDLL